MVSKSRSQCRHGRIPISLGLLLLCWSPLQAQRPGTELRTLDSLIVRNAAEADSLYFTQSLRVRALQCEGLRGSVSDWCNSMRLSRVGQYHTVPGSVPLGRDPMALGPQRLSWTSQAIDCCAFGSVAANPESEVWGPLYKDTAVVFIGGRGGIVPRPRPGIVPYNMLRSFGLPIIWQPDSVREGRRLLDRVRKAHPDWGATWYALALLAFDIDGRPDTALVLLGRAEATANIASGVLDWTRTRIAFRSGNVAEGQHLLLRSLSDTSWVSRGVIDHWLGAYLPSPLLMGWNRVPSAERGTWLMAHHALYQTLQDRLLQPPALAVLLSRVRSYRIGNQVAVAYALFRQNLFGRTDKAQPGKEIFPVNTRLVAVRDGDGMRVEQDTLRQLVGALRPENRLEEQGYITGVPLTLDLAPGRWLLTLYLRQPDGREAIQTLPEVIIPELTSALSVSDLILGAPKNGTRWMPVAAGSEGLWLFPVGEWGKREQVSAFTQLTGVKPGDSLRVTIDIYDLSLPRAERLGDSTRPGFIRLAFSAEVTANPWPWRHAIGIEQLKEGPYCLRVTFARGSEQVSVTNPIEIGLWTKVWLRWITWSHFKPLPRACLGGIETFRSDTLPHAASMFWVRP